MAADFVILEAIDRHGPLPTHYLYEFTKHLRRDYTHLQNRLTEFYNGDAQGPLLTRPPQQFACYGARYQHIVYGLAARARLLLAERGTVARYAPRSASPFVHQLMQACVGASFELTARVRGLHYISRDEILSRADQSAERGRSDPMAIPLSNTGKTLIPDDLFGLGYPGAGFRFFAVEADRNTESIERRNFAQTAFGAKIAGYLDVFRSRAFRTYWGIPNLHVLTVTTNATHARNILEHLRKRSEPLYAGSFGFATAPSFGCHWRVPSEVFSQLIEAPWDTAVGTKDIAAP